jgi:hypothetical protein
MAACWPDKNQMCGMTALARSFQARTLSLRGAAGRHVRAGRQNSSNGSDGSARRGALRLALRGDWCAPRPPSDI